MAIKLWILSGWQLVKMVHHKDSQQSKWNPIMLHHIWCIIYVEYIFKKISVHEENFFICSSIITCSFWYFKYLFDISLLVTICRQVLKGRGIIRNSGREQTTSLYWLLKLRILKNESQQSMICILTLTAVIMQIQV